MKRQAWILAIVLLVTTSLPGVDLPSIFNDHMVLQRNSQAKIWGIAGPNETIKVTGSWGETATTSANSQGEWNTQLPTGKAGGPYTLKVSDQKETVTLSDVLLGEVWLASGQSNMEMPMEGWAGAPIQNSKEEIANAQFPQIRMFTVRQAVAFEPQKDCAGEWAVCSPETVPYFSATAYFFGRKLYQELDVPIGLIHSSWGGTPVESWMPASAFQRDSDFYPVVQKIQNNRDEFLAYNQWLTKHQVINAPTAAHPEEWANLDFHDSMVATINFKDSDWHTMDIPQLWENADLTDFDGIVWFRKAITLPNDMRGKSLILSLGAIDDMDATYINGQLVGGFQEPGRWQEKRVFTIPADLTGTAKLSIAIRVIDTGGGGGLYGEKSDLYIAAKNDTSRKISLVGEWKYLPTALYRAQKFYTFDIENMGFYNMPEVPAAIGPFTPTFLYNGMIAPLIPYTIEGSIWYQGEANVERPEQYKTLFPGMIKSWRSKWNEGTFPFYYVQIAPFEYGDQTNSAELREAQFETMSVPNTGMAVTMDIGESYNIHPADKQDVGDRLARWALAKNYDRDVVYSGPLYQSMTVHGNEIILNFTHTDGGLMLQGDGSENFQIAGDDHQFHNALAQVQGNTVVVSSPNVDHPVAVKYTWSNIASGTLFNKAGLPSPSFRTDDWQN